LISVNNKLIHIIESVSVTGEIASLHTHAIMVWYSLTTTEYFFNIYIIYRLMCMYIFNVHSSRIRVNLLLVCTYR